jgi:hypothetical protein
VCRVLAVTALPASESASDRLFEWIERTDPLRNDPLRTLAFSLYTLMLSSPASWWEASGRSTRRD